MDTQGGRDTHRATTCYWAQSRYIPTKLTPIGGEPVSLCLFSMFLQEEEEEEEERKRLGRD